MPHHALPPRLRLGRGPAVLLAMISRAMIHGWRLAAVLLSVTGALFAQRSTTPNDEGRLRFQERNYLAAEAAFSRVIEADSSDTVAFYNRALCRYNLQNLTGARADLTRFLELQPDSTAGYALRASTQLHLGDPRAALTDADAALKLTPEDLDATLVRAQARYQLGLHEEAIEDFSHVLTVQPEHLAALTGRGNAALARGDAVSARADFSAAIRLTPRSADILFQLGQAHLRLLEMAEAAEKFDQVCRLAPESALAARSLGYARFGAGDHAGAARAFQRAVELDPKGSAYAYLMLHATALRAVDAHRPAVPADVLAWPDEWPRALAQFLQGAVSETDLLKRARTLSPASEQSTRLCEAQFYAGLVRLGKGDSKGARTAFRHAVDTKMSRLVEHTLARAELAKLL